MNRVTCAVSQEVGILILDSEISDTQKSTVMRALL